MNNNTVAFRAKLLGILLVTGIFLQLLGLAPGLEYISGSFPTYFHKTESIFLVLVLLISLVTVSFVTGQAQAIALIILGALMYYSGYKALISLSTIELMHARAIWASVAFLMTGALAWLVFGAFRRRILGWREMFFSLCLANIGFIYLRFAPLIN